MHAWYLFLFFTLKSINSSPQFFVCSTRRHNKVNSTSTQSNVRPHACTYNLPFFVLTVPHHTVPSRYPIYRTLYDTPYRQMCAKVVLLGCAQDAGLPQVSFFVLPFLPFVFGPGPGEKRGPQQQQQQYYFSNVSNVNLLMY